jgi:hypothetical protein
LEGLAACTGIRRYHCTVYTQYRKKNGLGRLEKSADEYSTAGAQLARLPSPYALCFNITKALFFWSSAANIMHVQYRAHRL